jgi:hypothetical protein
MEAYETKEEWEMMQDDYHPAHRCDSRTYKILFYLLLTFNLLLSPLIFVDGASKHVQSLSYSVIGKRTVQPQTELIKSQELFSDSEYFSRLLLHVKY